jgi:hypothetical protein
MGTEKVSHLPTLPVGTKEYILEGFLNKDRILTHNFNERKIQVSSTVN